MKKIIAVLLSYLAVSLAVISANTDTLKPNIVFILADDLGWRDLGCYGSTFYETPNIDSLARRGMLFTHAYATAPVCSPTRASILSGLYPARHGITQPSCQLPDVILEKQPLPLKAPPARKVITPISLTRLSCDYYVLPECLKDAGYATAHIGKWHCGWPPHGPENQGFDFTWPGCEMTTSYFAPYPMAMADGSIDLNAIHAPAGEHLQDRMTDEAIHWLKTNPHKPFFLNYWAFLPHVPLQAHPELIAKYEAKADPQNPQHNPIYAAMVETLDRNVGRLLNALDELGVADNTIIIFSSDNGGTDWTTYDTPPTSNFPLREGKGTAYDGGTRVPFILSLPGRVKSGAVCDALVSSIDFYPTLLDIAGVKSREDVHLDGISIMPALRGEKLERDSIFCLWPNYAAAAGKGGRPAAWVRCGDMKLIRFFADNDDQTDRFELYNLAIDTGESNNLASSQPEQTSELNRLLDKFLAETQAVIPGPNPAYKPSKVKAITHSPNSVKTTQAINTKISDGHSSTRPNVLFIMFDDLNDWALHPPEHPKALTPNMDRLRESSISFTQAHVAIPVCGPSRKCLFSGLYPQTRNDYHFSNWKSTPSLKNCIPIPLHFRNNGYETYGTGKLLHEGAGGDFYTAYGIAPDYGPWPWQGKDTPENTPHSAQFETWKEYLPIKMHRDLNYGPLSSVPKWKPNPSENIPGAKGWYNQDGKPFRYINDQDRDKMPDEISADWAIEILKQKHDHPFYLAVGFIRPHTPLYVPTKYLDMFPMEDIQLPPYLKNDLDDCATVLRNRWEWGFLKYQALIKAGGEIAWKEWVQAYLACMAFADEQAGKVLTALDENGYRDNTIVVMTSDNGYHVGEKDCIQKWHLWDESTRVPLFIRAPGLSQSGKTCGHPVSSIDIYPTLADLCGLPSNPNQNGGGPALDGHSLRPLLENPESDTWNGPPVALTGIRDGKENPHFSVRSRQYRYTLCGNGEEELYDHNTDPNEWTNLTANLEYMGIKKQLREEMTEIFRATKMPDGFIPDTAQPACE